MNIPEDVMKRAKKNIEPFDTEGFVLGKGPVPADIIMVGEAPGENEVYDGEPFTGRAGKELDKQLSYLGWTRDDVYITSVVRSRPYKWEKRPNAAEKRKANRKPNKKEVRAHAELLDVQIAQADPKVILLLGGVAYQRLVDEKGKISEVIGEKLETPILTYDRENDAFVSSEKEYIVIPLYHPAAVFYNPGIRDSIYESLDRLKSYL
ncbi:uracil-DNA glycosylase [Salimicrobium halophilum]|uniref:DNA polymerase n=1 Tax=Salimicrobium halophilum TaxID=86666 RepID=A0A1G8VRZ1_9BACI|nr:uracil-DNA glycosylase [Salimicrobium halophilum]SDJ68782.1 DNA polymerase [Salimicrobium halophilum]